MVSLNEIKTKLTAKAFADGNPLAVSLTGFLADQKAESGAGKVIQLFIVAILAGAMLPTAIATLVDVNTSNWSSTDALMWGLITTFIILAVVLYIMPLDRLRRL